jgi:spore coat polysaccharide biosynthesis predicted glycosyltransferase SpsG
MKSSSSLRVLFRAPAGSRRGFGHLVRCLSLARAMGVRPLIALRGSRQASDIALALGAELVAKPSRRTVQALEPDVVVVDDPVTTHARRWIAAARSAGAVVVTIHDLGLGALEGDLVIDASLGLRSPGAGAPKGSLSLAGSQFALLDPRIQDYKRTGDAYVAPTAEMAADAQRRGEACLARTTGSKRVVIALGGGPHSQTADAIAGAITAADPGAEVRIVAGFVAAPKADHDEGGRVRWTTSTNGLAPELAHADVAIVGGGMSLYEACAMGVPAVALPVVEAQTPTVRAFAERGAALPAFATGAAAEAALKLLNNPRQRAALARRSTQLVDGKGAWRAAEAVYRLIDTRCS